MILQNAEVERDTRLFLRDVLTKTKYIIYHLNNVAFHTQTWACYNSNRVTNPKHALYVLQSNLYLLSLSTQAQFQGG
jgi:hypothetical protein